MIRTFWAGLQRSKDKLGTVEFAHWVFTNSKCWILRFQNWSRQRAFRRNNLFCVFSYLGTSDICNLGMLEVRRRRLHLDCRVCSFGALHRSESCAAKCGNLFVGWIFEPPCWTAVRKPGPVLHASRCRTIWWEMHVPFGSPFSSVSSPIFVSKFSFCSIHQDLQDWRTFAPLQSEHVRNILTNICHLL